MGVLEHQKRVFFTPVSGDNATSSDDDETLRIRESPPPILAPGRNRPPPSPATYRRTGLVGHTLKLKKGRRSKQRYDNERILFASVDIDPEEVPQGLDIGPETNSHFALLLDEDNKELLEDFLNSKEVVKERRKRNGKRRNSVEDDDDEDSDAAFLRISGPLRQAVKKHLPYGILENLEDNIREHFLMHPQQEYVAVDLSSYERLLAHVCSMYHHLNSRSYDEDGKRKLKIGNPKEKFDPIDPSLAKYLKNRCNK